MYAGQELDDRPPGSRSDPDLAGHGLPLAPEGTLGIDQVIEWLEQAGIIDRNHCGHFFATSRLERLLSRYHRP
jgi:hypothetical protein